MSELPQHLNTDPEDIRTDVDLDISDDGEVRMKSRTIQYCVPYLTRNQWEKINGNNGFSRKRQMRKVASVPVVALQAAKDMGIDISDQKELRAWLDMHSEFWTVEHIDSGRDPRIIVK